MSNRYSPRAVRFTLSALLSLTLSFSSSAFAAERVAKINEFHIAQEIFRKNGVLVVRPKDLDVKLMNLMRSENIRTLEDYARWLKETVKYKKDGKRDSWAGPQETLQKKNGDCEDYTLLNTAMLKVLGFESRFLALKNSRQAHAICVFKRDGYYYWFDNAELKKTDARTLPELARHLLKNKQYSSLFEVDVQKQSFSLVDKRS